MPARAYGSLWRWTDGRTGDRRVDCLYVRLFDRKEDRMEGQGIKLLYPRSQTLMYTR